MTDPFLDDPGYEPVSQAELQARERQAQAEAFDRVRHMVVRLAGMSPYRDYDTPENGAVWTLRHVATDNSNGMLFRLESVLSRLLEAEHARLREVVMQVQAQGYINPDQMLLRCFAALLIEIGAEEPPTATDVEVEEPDATA